MINWLLEKLATSRIKKILDELPFDGWKTVIGVVILILAAVAAYYQGTNPQLAAIIAWVIEVLSQLDPTDVGDISFGVIVIGVVHKVLKWAEVIWTKNKKELGDSATTTPTTTPKLPS